MQALKRFSLKKLNTFYSEIIFRANLAQFFFVSFSIFITAVNYGRFVDMLSYA